MNYTILCKPRRDARVVEWAGLEIRSLSQDRGFESLSLLWNEKRSRKASLFVSSEIMVDENPRRGFDWPRESEANTARSRITASGRNPKGGEGTECDWAVPSLSLLERGEWNWNEVNVLSNPSHSLEWVRMLSYWERTWGNWKWPNDPIPLSPREWECTFLECQIDLVQREDEKEQNVTEPSHPSLSLRERECSLLERGECPLLEREGARIVRAWKD